MLRTRVKMCGFTQRQDAVFAANLGVDAIGMVFYQGSPRAVDIDLAQAIAHALPPFVSVVGLFVNPDKKEVFEVMKHVHLDMLQFHGTENDQFCSQFQKPFLKAIGVKSAGNLLNASMDFPNASGLLLDYFDPQKHGGTGNTFDWAMVPKNLEKPIVLAGGLDAANVSSAIQMVKPYGVDVSSGIEIEKGKKESGKMTAFMRAVKQVNGHEITR